MAAIDNKIVAREAFSLLAKRQNFAQKNPGVIVVFCVVFVVATGLIALQVYKVMSRKKAARNALVV